MNNNPNYRAIIGIIRTLHASMAFIMVLFGAIVFWLNTTNPIGFLNEENEFMLYIPGILLLVAIPTSTILFKNQVRGAYDRQVPLDRKLSMFQVGHLIRMATFEAAGLMGAAISLITGNNYNLGTLFLVLLSFLFLFPSSGRISIDLKLTPQERALLERSNR